MQNNKAMLIYDYNRDCIQNHNFSPTVREICENVGIKSTSTVHYYLQMLEEKGYIVKDPLKKRTIKLPGGGSKSVPLLGTVTAGIPITAIQEIEEYIPVSNLSGNAEDYFALHVRGDSMIGAHIRDGDLVCIRIQPDVDDGQIAAVLIGEDATLKRVYHRPDGVMLVAENPSFPPMVYIGEECEDIRILGKAMTCISKVR